MGPKNRDILNHGIGKGDVDRTANIGAFKKNYAGINWFDGTPLPPGDEVLVNSNHPKRFFKRYGAAINQHPPI